MYKPRIWNYLLICIVAVGATTGCATKNYVRGEVGTSESAMSKRAEELGSQVEANQAKLRNHDDSIAAASSTAQEALERAIAAGKLAEGKLLYETVLTDDRVRFGVDSATLSTEAQEALNAFAETIIAEGGNVYIEIQGHTDSVGSEAHNLKLGERRAGAVRRYLNGGPGLALHRMSVISYGEAAPTDDNSTREGRARNRRVALVVLQ